MTSARVTCLCVTERRPAFMPWLLWNFDRQSFPAKELVIVDSSPEPFTCARKDVRVIAAPPGSNVPTKRNLALTAAEGDIIAWFDDDDWQHPERLARLVEALDAHHDYAGTSRSWFLDIHGQRCQEYFGYRALIFNSAGYKRELARSVRFDERVRKASDTIWLRDLGARQPRLALLDEQLGLWLCHDDNISNARTRRRFPSQLRELKASLGEEAWGDTDARLDELRARLPPPLDPRLTQYPLASDDAGDAPPHVRPARRLRDRGRSLQTGLGAHAPEHEPAVEAIADPAGPPLSGAGGVTEARAGAPCPELESQQGLPDVSLALLLPSLLPRGAGALASLELTSLELTSLELTSLELTSLELLSAHVRRQAKYPLSECFGLLLGEAQAESAAAPGVPRGLDRLLAPAGGAAQEELLATYCSAGARGWSALPERTLNELWAVHRAPTDHVLLCHGGVFFHASGGSWVREALERLRDDASLRLVTTQAGPPAGPVGHPRARPQGSGSYAHWDRRARVWRARETHARYFLLDRRRLLGALPVGDTPPPSLAAWIGAAFARGPGACGSLATRGSWAVQASTGLPDARWLSTLVELVERGAFPRTQLGKLELQLADASALDAWLRLMAPPPSTLEKSTSARSRAA